MLIVNGIEIDFDITSPTDVMRYKAAGEKMETEAASIERREIDEDDPEFFDAYCEMLNSELKLYGNYLDEVFGDGAAEKLLSNNPSLTKITEVSDAIAEAMEKQGKDFGVKLQKYQPNRATRRA